VIDLMIVYTKGLAQSLGTNLMTRLNFLVTRANTSYADSEVAITLRLVQATMVDYSDLTTDNDALYAATPGCPASCGAPFDPVTFGAIEGIRAAAGADLVSVLRNGSAFGGSGLAWVGSTSPNPLYSYSVITGCTAGCESVFIHELGHNMGNKHDRATTAWQAGGVASPTGGAFSYSFGYAFCSSGLLTCNPNLPPGSGGCSAVTQPECSTNGGSNFSDIMAYFHGSTERIYKFSNPAVNCASSVGDGVPRPCGVSSALPSTSADTAQSMNGTRIAMSSIKGTVVSTSLPGSLQFTATGYSAAESAGSVVLTVSRVGATPGVGNGAVSVNYATADGSAIAGLDYVSSSGNLFWAAGDTSNKTITVPLINDGVNENSEAFTVTLSGPSGAAGVYLGFPSSVPVLILSAWPPGGTIPAGWSSSATPTRPWTAVASPTYEGTGSLQSFNALAAVQGTFVNSDLTTPSMTFVSGNISFAYRVSAYPSYGYVELLIDGVSAFSDTDTTGAVGPPADWKVATVPVTAGAHTLTFRFRNRLNFACAGAIPAPPSGGSCADRAWIDALSLPLALPNPTNVLISSLNPANAGQLVTFTATLGGASGTPTGIVNFKDGISVISGCASVTAVSGVATCATSALSVGPHSVTAQYSGDVTYASFVSNTVAQTINAAAAAAKPFDFNGDGKSDIVWRSGSDAVEMWLMNGTTATAQGTILGGGSGYFVKHVADFDGDGKADILWESAPGATSLWLMNGLAHVGGADLLSGGTGWAVKHVADFNGDGKSDVLWEHTTNGASSIWLFDGITHTGGVDLIGPGSGWKVKFIADFNGDGKKDLLWEHTSGATSIWIMDGIVHTTGVDLIGGGSGWKVVQVGDFNGDGKTDLIWEHTDGTTTMWLMDGIVVTAGAGLVGPATGYHVKWVADFNGDGKSDLIWERTDGAASMWLLNGVSSIGTVGLIGPGSGYSIVKVRDLNGDGKADLIWQFTDGSTSAWLMNGLVAAGSGNLRAGSEGFLPSP
jgi:hypothetical protein